MIHESAGATAVMVVLPGVLGSRILRRTVQVCLGYEPLRLPGNTPICFALAALRSVPQAGSWFLVLGTQIHEPSGLGQKRGLQVRSYPLFCKGLGKYNRG